MYKYRLELSRDNSINNIVLSTINNNLHVVDTSYNDKLNECKNKIEKYYSNNLWDKLKKIINPYELIYITNKKYRYKSIAKVEPLSRSYFKMIEIAHEFLEHYYINPYLDKYSKIKSAKTLHLAEGPGGFVEGWNDFRNSNEYDIQYAITLSSDRKEIPGWHKSTKFLKNNKNIKIITGLDNRGDLYNPDNIIYLANRLGEHSMDVITADGGFDFSVGYNMQEHYASKLIYCQILVALKCQMIGGTFICKFFDINNKLTYNFLRLLGEHYDIIDIYKPYTSRVANSERYIVCSNYCKAIDNNYWRYLISLLIIWNKNNDIHINSIFSNTNVKDIKYLKRINNKMLLNQVLYINNTIKLIENKVDYDETWYCSNYKNQRANALRWCIRNNVPYNIT